MHTKWETIFKNHKLNKNTSLSNIYNKTNNIKPEIINLLTYKLDTI